MALDNSIRAIGKHLADLHNTILDYEKQNRELREEIKRLNDLLKQQDESRIKLANSC